MNPIIIKLIGAAIGAIFADTLNKNLTRSENGRITQLSKAKTMPGAGTDEIKPIGGKTADLGSGGPDSGLSDEQNQNPTVRIDKDD